MGLFSRLRSNMGPAASTPGPLDDFWYGPAGAGSWSGVRIDANTAMKVSAVWRCVHLIAGTTAWLPLHIYERTGADGSQKVIARNHPLYDLLHLQPNRWQTSYDFREMLTAHVLLRGNAYAELVGGPRGPVDSLIPLHPDRVRPERLRSGALVYHVHRDDGRLETLSDDQVFHLRGLSDDGLMGLGVLEHAREQLGIARSQEQFAARFFGQSPAPGLVLTHPGKLSDQARKHLQESIQQNYSGPNAHRPMVLEEGMVRDKADNVGLTAEDAQLIASREFSVQDIARWFGVPNHLVGETTKETSWGSGIEQMSIGFVTYTLSQWLKRWEQSISRDLILNPARFFAEHVLDGLLRGDTKSRYEAYQIALQNQWMTPNEVRRLENMNPLPGMDAPIAPPAPAAPAAALDDGWLVVAGGHRNGANHA